LGRPPPPPYTGTPRRPRSRGPPLPQMPPAALSGNDSGIDCRIDHRPGDVKPGAAPGCDGTQEGERPLDRTPLRAGMQGDGVRVHLEEEVRHGVRRVDVPAAGRVILGAREVADRAVRVAE